jgi:hypothetical protein
MNRDPVNPYARHPDDTSDFALVDPANYDPSGAPTLIDPAQTPAYGQPALADPAEADAGLASAHEVDLSEDPFADDLAERLDAVAPRRWANRTTVALAGLVLLVGGFVAGAQVQKHWGTTAANSAARGNSPFANATANPFAGGTFGGGTGRGGTGTGGTGATGGARGGTTGTVKLVDGTTVYLTTTDGQTLIVKTTSSTTVSLNQAGSLKDLTPGATVTIQGQTGSDGSLSATSITKTK